MGVQAAEQTRASSKRWLQALTDIELHWYLGFGIIWSHKCWFEVVNKWAAVLKGVEQQGNSLELCTETTDFC